MSDEPRIFVGNGKVRTEPFWNMRLSLTAEDVQKLQDNLENGWVNTQIKERRSPSPTGFTHYMEIDTWKPGQGSNDQNQSSGSGDQKASPQKKKEEAIPEPNDSEDIEEISAEDLPF